MNCNIEILQTFRYTTPYGEAEIKAGELYSGTAGDGGVVFHVTIEQGQNKGKIAPVILEANDERVKIYPFKEHKFAEKHTSFYLIKKL